METIHAMRAGTHSLRELQDLVKAARHMGACTPPNAGAAGQEVEIDVDREIWCLELLSGVADDVGHGARQTRDYVAWVASLCADAVDRGDSMAQVRMTVEAAVRHCAPAWRNLAQLLAQRIAIFVRWYGVETADGPSGEVIRWLFVETEPHPSGHLH